MKLYIVLVSLIFTRVAASEALIVNNTPETMHIIFGFVRTLAEFFGGQAIHTTGDRITLLPRANTTVTTLGVKGYPVWKFTREHPSGDAILMRAVFCNEYLSGSHNAIAEVELFATDLETKADFLLVEPLRRNQCNVLEYRNSKKNRKSDTHHGKNKQRR